MIMKQQNSQGISEPSSTAPSIKSNLPLIVGGLVVLVLVGIGSYILGSKFQQGETTENTVTPKAQPSSSATEMDEWKTYTHETLGFTIKYPSNWFNPYNDSFQASFSDVNSDSPFDTRVGINATVQEKSIFDKMYSKSGSEKFVLDGQPAVKIRVNTAPNAPTEPYSALEVYSYYNGMLYKLFVMGSTKQIEQQYEPYFLQMLSSFKFRNMTE
jgi:hypothetical protein